MAGWVGGAASVAMLLSVADVMSKLNTVDKRQSITDFLASQGGTSLNIDVDQALLIARIGLLVTGAAAAATLVFAVFAVRRDKSARIAMSVLAVPLLVCGVFIDPFLAGFIVASAVLLWTRPAGDWFAGRAPRPERVGPAPGPPGGAQPEHPLGQAPPSPPAHEPLASAPSPFGSSYGEPTSAPGPPAVAFQQPGPYRAAHEAPATPRPRQVTTACAIAWATSAVVALMMVGTLFAMQSGPVVRDLRDRLGNNPALVRSGMTFEDLVVLVRVAVVVVLLWALAAIVLAVLAYRRQNWARIALAISAVVAAVLGLVSSVSFLGFFLVSAAAVASAVLLFNRESSRWYAGAHDRQPGRPPRQQPPTQPW